LGQEVDSFVAWRFLTRGFVVPSLYTFVGEFGWTEKIEIETE